MLASGRTDMGFITRILNPPPPGEARPPPEDCLECRLIGSGAMFSFSGLFLWQNRTFKPSHSQFRFNALLSACFAAAGIARLLC